MKIKFEELLARKKYDLPDNWEVYAWNASNEKFLRLSGAVCTELFKKGPNAGRKNWKKRDRATDMTVTIGKAEMREFLAQWEAETGKCSTCQGTGQEWSGWSQAEGMKYKTCTGCSGTGAAPDKVAA